MNGKQGSNEGSLTIDAIIKDRQAQSVRHKKETKLGCEDNYQEFTRDVTKVLYELLVKGPEYIETAALEITLLHAKSENEITHSILEMFKETFGIKSED